jgi:hypothetical protein
MHRITRDLAAGLAAAALLIGVAAAPAAAATHDNRHSLPAPIVTGNAADNLAYKAASLLPASCPHRNNGTYQGTVYGVSAWIIYDDYMVQGDTCQIGKSRLTLQRDGNLVLYDENGRARWAASWTKPDVLGQGSYADFQYYDGNYVLYSGGNIPLWASGTCCRTGAELAVQADGNLVIYDSNVKAVWATNTWH